MAASDDGRDAGDGDGDDGDGDDTRPNGAATGRITEGRGEPVRRTNDRGRAAIPTVRAAARAGSLPRSRAAEGGRRDRNIRVL
ncbi:hypothetical protein BRC90_02300 [Halobacteriales archaeon QS_4_69_34]|nr:MAG: hypothetical protein BRC90_02300 [Halobacteriales archaeon QS_4_69_34]